MVLGRERDLALAALEDVDVLFVLEPRQRANVMHRAPATRAINLSRAHTGPVAEPTNSSVCPAVFSHTLLFT